MSAGLSGVPGVRGESIAGSSMQGFRTALLPLLHARPCLAVMWHYLETLYWIRNGKFPVFPRAYFRANFGGNSDVFRTFSQCCIELSYSPTCGQIPAASRRIFGGFADVFLRKIGRFLRWRSGEEMAWSNSNQAGTSPTQQHLLVGQGGSGLSLPTLYHWGQ